MAIKSYSRVFSLNNKYFKFFSLFFVGFMFFIISWKRSGDLLIDFGGELYIPWRLSRGDVLYKDIFHIFGPFSQYINSFVFRIFGVNISCLVLFNTVIVGIFTIFLYKFISSISDEFTAYVSSFVFLSNFAFACYILVPNNYNFITPYSHELVHALILSLFALVLLKRYFEKFNSLDLGYVGLLLGLVFLTKAEIFLSIFISVLVSYYLYLKKKKVSIKVIISSSLLFWVGFFIPTFLFLFYFSSYITYKKSISVLLFQYKNIFLNNKSLLALKFYKNSMGILDIKRRILEISLSFFSYLSIEVIFLFLLRIKKKLYRILVWVFLFGLYAFFVSKYLLFYLGLVVVIPILCFYFLYKLLKLRESRYLILFSFSSFAFFCLFKEFFNVRIYHYGFVLTFPSLIVFIIFLLYEFPKDFNIPKIKKYNLVFLLLLLLPYILLEMKNYLSINFPFGVEKERVYVYKTTNKYFMSKVLSRLKKIIPKDKSLVVLPEGIGINYILRRRSNFYTIYTPPIFQMVKGDLYRNFSKNPSDFVMLWYRDMSEFGKSFYMGYGKDIVMLLHKKYKEILSIGGNPFNRDLGVKILKIK